MTREEIFEVIVKNIRLVIEDTEDREVAESDSMADYGADSLEIVEVVSRSMKETRIKVPRNELSTADNLGELLNLFEKAQTQQAG